MAVRTRERIKEFASKCVLCGDRGYYFNCVEDYDYTTSFCHCAKGRSLASEVLNEKAHHD